MPRVIVTPEAAALIRAAAELPYRDTSTKLPNGQISIPIDADTLEALKKHQLPGESLSDTIIRGLAVMRGLN